MRVHVCYCCMYYSILGKAPWKNSLTEWSTLYKYIWNIFEKMKNKNNLALTGLAIRHHRYMD